MANRYERALCAVEFDEQVGRMRLTSRIRSQQVRAEIANVRMDLAGFTEIKDLYDVLGQLLIDVQRVAISLDMAEGGPDEN